MASTRTNSLGPKGRLYATGVAIGAASPLVVASTLTPAQQGIGTHTALGLPACGWQTTMNLPCPSCGMTTSFSHAVHGDLLSAFMTQPAGLVLCVLTAMVGMGAAYGALTGAPMHRLGLAAMRPATLWALLAVVLAGWVFKMVIS